MKSGDSDDVVDYGGGEVKGSDHASEEEDDDGDKGGEC